MISISMYKCIIVHRSVMAQVACPSESSHLLVNTASEDSPPLQQKSVCNSCPPSKHLCLPSKAAILILLLTIVVGAIYYNFVGFSAILVMDNPRPNTILSEYEPLPYAILAIVMMFYPLSGFIADVCCGRLKTVVISLICLLSCWILLLLALSVLETISHPNADKLRYDQGILVVILLSFSLFAFIVGLAGYQANFIQLGLDQLFEAPSQYLGLFIHYATWTFCLGSFYFLMNAYMVFCSTVDKSISIAQLALQVILPIILVMLLLISFWKRRWFHSEPGHHNPYKTVYNVIKFAKRHKHPLQRSAFTHCDNYIPSRLDFAKERFGGPFTTEQVENVKTFLRILLILLAVGPVFVLEVPASYFIFPLFDIHFHHHYHLSKIHFCTDKFIWRLLLETVFWIVVPILVLFPLYIWIVFSLLRKKVVKLFTRLGFGIFICFLGVLCLLITDTIGHAMYGSNSNNHTLCVFHVTISGSRHFTSHSLHTHWAVIIPSSVLLGIGPLLVIATTLEFISAQSPQSMKGLLVGVFFAIRGLFQFLNSIVIIPLSLKQPWASREMIEHPPVTNCGFVYLVLTSVTGLIGLILFSVAAKRYKYRTRDEGIFRQHDVEEIYDRYIAQAALENYSYESIDD